MDLAGIGPSRKPVVRAIFASAVVAIFLTLLGQSVFASNTSTPPSMNFSSPINLSNDGGNASFPWIANAGTNVYVAWSEFGAGLMFRSSPDGGYTWSPAVSSPAMRLSNPGGVSQAPIVCAAGSDVYIAWSQTVGSTGLQVFVASSTNSGASFASPKQLSSGSPFGGWVTPVCAAAASNAYVAWVNGSPNQSWVSSSNDNGATWSVPYNYAQTREPEAAAVGANAYIYSNRDLIVTHNGGQNWNQVLNQNSLFGDEGQISASGKYVYLATQTKTSNGFIRLYYSNNDGNTFHRINDSTPTLNDSWEPMVGSYGQSAWIALLQYPGGSNANITLFDTHNGGTSWSAPFSLSGSGHDVTYPETVTTTDGKNIFVVWSQEISSGYWVLRVGYSPDGGKTWSAVPGIDVSQNTVGEAGFQLDLATAAIASYGSYCYATWQYVNGASSQIYFSTSAPGTVSSTTASYSFTTSSISSSSQSTTSSASTIHSSSSSTNTNVHSSSSSTVSFPPPVTSSSSEQVTVSNSQSTSAAFQSGTMSPVALAVIGTAIIATIAIASILYVRSKSLRKK